MKTQIIILTERTRIPCIRIAVPLVDPKVSSLTINLLEIQSC